MKLNFSVECKSEKVPFRYDSGILNKVSMLMAYNKDTNFEGIPGMWALGTEVQVGQTAKGR